MKFSIITPSFKQPDWLRLCLASVADQKGNFEVEHIVQDNCSGDAVNAVVAGFPNAQLVAEKDKGMYDAVNNGLKRSTGDICAYLNCDEQYLPGALEMVAEYFESHPEVEVLFANCVLISPDGSYLCSRPVLRPHYYHTKICHTNVFTAATFMRRKVFAERGHFFDTTYRDSGDCVWVLGLMEKKIPFATLGEATSAFADTGANMNLSANARREANAVTASAPAWARAITPFWSIMYRLRKLFAGYYSLPPFSYAVYTQSNPKRRTQFDVEKPVTVWWSRLSMVR